MGDNVLIPTESRFLRVPVGEISTKTITAFSKMSAILPLLPSLSVEAFARKN